MPPQEDQQLDPLAGAAVVVGNGNGNVDGDDESNLLNSNNSTRRASAESRGARVTMDHTEQKHPQQKHQNHRDGSDRNDSNNNNNGNNNYYHATGSVIPPLGEEGFDRPSTLRRESFLIEFSKSKGPPQIVLLMLLLALGFGSTIGVVPAVMSDRYARLNHGYATEKECSRYGPTDHKPHACLQGSADAQNAVAYAQLISNMLTFFTSSLIGSLSDEHGRRGILLLGIFLSVLSPLCLVLIQIIPSMTPTYYYSADSITGLINWVAVALSSLSDVMPPKWRAPAFGLLLAGFSLGFALAPQLALLMGHFYVSIFSLVVVASGFGMTYFFFPETLSPEEAAHATEVRQAQLDQLSTTVERLIWNVKRPLRELMILNRNRLFRLLSLLAFFSGMVSSADRTLLLYYLEERLGFDDRDIAVLFLIMGILGIFVQAFFLKIINDAIGERWVVTLCFGLGTLVNLLYGLARTKTTIFVAIAIGAFGGMAFPTISAIKSNNVDKSEQGRIQGALYSLSALASGLGPMVLRFVYHYTKDGALFGPGSMFVIAGMLYLVAVYAAFLLPHEADSKGQEEESLLNSNSSLDEENQTCLEQTTRLL